MDLEAQQHLKRLEPEKAQVLRRLRAFSIFDISLNPGIGNLSPAMQDLYEYYRPHARMKLVGKIIKHWIKKGTLPNFFTFHALGGAHYAKATGGSGYRTGMPTHHQRIFDSTQALWEAVYDAAQDRGLTPSDLDAIHAKFGDTNETEDTSSYSPR